MIPRVLQWLNRHLPHILHWLSRCILAGLFIYSGYIKMQNGWLSTLQFSAVLAKYQLFPDRFLWPIAEYFPWVEITLGLFFLIGWKFIRYVAGAATALLLFFMAILTITYLRGIDANCGCFSMDDRISPGTIARDSLILIPALYLLFTGSLLKRRLKNKNPEPGIEQI
jgi:putative oxidoreductase